MSIRSILQSILGGMLMGLAACGNGVAVQGEVAGAALSTPGTAVQSAGAGAPLSTSGTPVQAGTGRASLVPDMSGDARLLACLHCAP